MRSDHISAWLLKQWMQSHAPHLIDGWDFDPEPVIKEMAAKVDAVIPAAGAGFTSQNVLARTAIERWGLQDVALVGGGMPTPLSPTPQQVALYTDASEAVIADAAALGYNALKVDVSSAEDVAKLRGARTVIATGLIHFLPDEAITTLFERLDTAGVTTVFFNTGNRTMTAELTALYAKLGYKLNWRDPEEIADLLPAGWAVTEVHNAVDVLALIPEIGPLLADQPPHNNFYRVERAQ